MQISVTVCLAEMDKINLMMYYLCEVLKGTVFTMMVLLSYYDIFFPVSKTLCMKYCLLAGPSR